MKQNELEQALQADPELDAALAQMAEEVPPMPADFHDKWMDAVRADARDRQEEENGRRRAVSPARWTRILSAAAAFIFLIGGTVLYRNSKRSLDGALRNERKDATLTAAEAPAAGDAAETEEDAFADGAAAGYAAMTADAAVEEAAEEADYAVPPLFMNAAGDARAYEAASKAASEDAALYAEEEAYEADGEEADFAVMEEAAEAPQPTAMPTEPAAEEAEAEAEAPAETAEGGFLQDAGAFFTDMGDFLLAALPYLAVLAVPAAAALVVRRRKKEKRGVR